MIDMIRDIRNTILEFDEKFPPSERLVKIKASRETMLWLRATIGKTQLLDPVWGVPVEEMSELPYKSYTLVFADGSAKLCNEQVSFAIPALRAT